MNPVDHFWTFLKSDWKWKNMKRDLENQRREDEQQPLRKPFTQPYTEAEKLHLRELLGEQDDRRAAEASQTDVAMNRVSTDLNSTGQMEDPPPADWGNLPPEEIEDMKYRRNR